MSSTPAASAGPKAPGHFPVAAKVALACLFAALLFELATRALVFSDVLGSGAVAAEIRRVDNYAHPEEDLYWWLRVHFGEGAGPHELENYHPELGWTPWPTEDFAHPREQGLGERRPVLLFGDSFSACTTPAGDCFQGLLDGDPLGASHGLLNFGAFAYGLDQIALLVDRSVERYVARDPVVVVGLLVDRDLDRAALSFRGTQNKPRFDVRDGELVLVPPRANGVFPPMPPALLGPRLAVHRLPVPEWVHDLFCGRRAVIERNKLRCRLLLTSIVQSLEARGLESFFLLFHSRETLDDRTWEDELVKRTLDELGARWVSTSAPLVDHARVSGRERSEYYGQSDHLNALGNFVAFRALREGLEGMGGVGSGAPWTESELAGPLSPANFASMEVRGKGGAVRYQFGSRPEFGSENSALFFSVGRKGPSEVTFELGGRAASFSATALFHPMARVEDEGSVVLTVHADGEQLAGLALRRTDPAEPFSVDLLGRATMTLRVDDAGDGTRGDWLLLTGPRFRVAP